MARLSPAYDDYFRALENVDPLAAENVVLRLLDDGESVETIALEVLAPAQARVGALWAEGRWSVADEHAATAVTEAAVSALQVATLRRIGPHPPADRHVLFACAEGDWHALPARLVGVVTAAAGVRVTMLGPSVPAEHLARRLRAGDVDVLALSCSVPSNLIGAARSVAAAHEAGVPVLVGGRAFGASPVRAQAIGADGWASDARALRTWTPPPELAQADIPAEALWLGAADHGELVVAYERMLEAFPRLQEMTPYQQARTREDMRWMAHFAAAAVLTGDGSILDEFFEWLGALLRGRVSTGIMTAAGHLVADAVEPHAPVGAELLRSAATRATARAARQEV